MLKKLAKCIREYKKPSILSMVYVGLEVVMECFLPLIMTVLMDLFNAISYVKINIPYQLTALSGKINLTTFYDLESIRNYLVVISIILVLMAGLSLVFGILSGKYCAEASAGLSKNLRGDMYRSISRFSFSNIDKFSSSSLVTRMTTDVMNVQMAYMMIVRTAVRSPLMLIFSVIMTFLISPNLAWIFLLVIPVLFIGLVAIIYFAMPRFRSVFKKYDKLNNSVQENIAGIRTVKSFVREEYEIKKFNTAAEDVKGDFIKAERLVALNNPIFNFAIYLINVLVIFVGTNLIINSNEASLNTAGLSSLIVYGIQCLMSLMMLSMIIVMITLAIESARRICEVLDESPTILNPENPIYEVEDGSIEFKNVSFKYKENAKKYALNNINIKIESGMTVGIIGGTGSSKTTLVNLISRLYDTSIGEVYVGNRNVKEYDLKTLRDQVSVVLQKNLLFSGTIKSNLLWGDENATEEEIIKASKLACADEFVQNFADKYDHPISQGGANVSGGQKQRLCIARALLKKPKILILDDSTSAVDTKTDALIRKAFRKEIPSTTKIIIAQRISSIQEADLILVLDNGELVSSGKHEDLLKTSKIYQEVYYSQNKTSKEEN